MALLALLGGWLVLYYGLTPLLIRFSQRSAASPQIEPIAPFAYPQEIADYLAWIAPALAQMGYQIVGYYTVRQAATNATPYFAWLINPQTKDKAMITAILTKTSETQKLLCYTEFSTRFADGKIVNTSNSASIGCYKKSSDTRTTRLPGVLDLSLLHRAHQKTMREFAPNAAKVLPDPGTELAYLRDNVFVESSERQVKFGIMYLDRANDCYRPTLYGAYYMTWQLIWPVKNIRLMALRRRAAEFLRALNAGESISRETKK